MVSRSINAETAPMAAGGYSQATESKNTSRRLYISGQIPETRDGALPTAFKDQARQVWADGHKVGLACRIEEIAWKIKTARRVTTMALTLEEKLAGQNKTKLLESLHKQKWRTLLDTRDEVNRRRAELIAQIEGKPEQKIEAIPLPTNRQRLH